MPKIVDHDERRSHIISAVRAIIVRDGFDRVTMREIAAEVGYAHGAITRYFPSKHEILTAVFRNLHDAAYERIVVAIEESRGLSSLRRISQILLPYDADGRANARVVLAFWSLAAQDADANQIYRHHYSRWRQLFFTALSQAADDGELRRDTDVETATDEIVSRNAGWQVLAALRPDEVTNEQLSHALDALIRELSE